MKYATFALIFFAAVYMWAAHPRAAIVPTPKPVLKYDSAIQKQLGMPFPVGKNTMLFNQAAYEGTLKSHGEVTINYESLLPAPRGFGGCAFNDETQPGSYMPVISSDSQHVTVQAPLGHRIGWNCRWTIRKEMR